LIEEINQNNDDQLQSSFQVYDGCSGKSKFNPMLVNDSIIKQYVLNYQVAQMNARLLPTFTNAAVTLLQVSPTIFSHAQKATPRL
jgi:hypothetical protein